MPQTLNIPIRGIHCASCVQTIQNASREVPGVTRAEVNFATQTAQLDVDLDQFTAEAFLKKLREAGYDAEIRRVTLQVKGLDDPSQIAPLQLRLQALKGILRADANYTTGTVAVEYIAGWGEETDIHKAIQDAGFTVGAVEHHQEADTLRWRLVTAAAASVITMALTLAHFFGRHIPYAEPILFVAASIVLLWCGWPFHVSFIRSLAHLRTNMNTLISIGTIAAYAYGFLVDPMFYETTVMIIAIVLLGRYLEHRTRRRTSQAIEQLSRLVPSTATLIDGRQVPIDQLQVDDRVLVRPGDRMPCDGEIIEGDSTVDESMLTGESKPIEKKSGDKTFAGTLNLTGAIKVRVATRDTILASIVRKVQEAQGSKADIERLADRVSSVFVPIVLALAVTTFLLWGDWKQGGIFAMAVLVIACPCALGLATPTAIVTAVGRATLSGILIKNAHTLEELPQVKTVAFDKTGTLTEGRPEIVAKWGVDVLRWAAAIEKNSKHPLAQAIVQAAGDVPDAASFELQAGLGVAGEVEGRKLVIGNADFMRYRDIEIGVADEFIAAQREKGRTLVFVGLNGRLAAIYAMADTPRPEARRVVQQLMDRGLNVVMITGDNEMTAAAVGSELGITRIQSEILPQDKAREVEKLQKEGKVAFVGDGINDAPSLVQADVGIALSTGQDIAMESADIVFVRGSLRKVLAVLDLARRTRAVIVQNLWWALGYNVILIPLAAGALYPSLGVMIPPMLASGFMALSSVTVVFNSLRLRKLTPYNV